MLALFEAAARFTDDLPPGSQGLFLDSLAGQEIAGDTIAEQAVREECVRVLTAHRSKGLEWDVVVVAGVQEEVWPDLRLRGSLLGADELAEAARPDAVGLDGGLAPGEGGERIAAADVAAAALAARLLAEERRLFYVAVTRARRLLVVTASGGDEQDRRPSASSPSSPATRSKSSGRARRPAGCRCPRSSPTSGGPPPTPRPRARCARPRPASCPGWRRRASAARTRRSGTR